MLESATKSPYLPLSLTLLLPVIIILNCLYRQPLYSLGISLILQAQQHSFFILDFLFLCVTTIIDPTVVVTICVIMLVVMHDKGKSLVMILFVIVNTYFAALMKAYYCDPRPFWTHQSVRNIGMYCPVEYGNPSGHSWFSAVFGFGLLIDYMGVGKHYQYLWISIAAIVLMPLSRMYLGAHALNQVLQGLCMGMTMCILYVIKLKQVIFRYLSEFEKNNIWKLVIAAMHILYIIPYIAHRKQEMPPQWQKNILQKCGVIMNQQKLNALMLLANAFLVNLLTGIGLGYSVLASSPLGKHFLQGSWQINQQKYELTRGKIYLILTQLLCLGSGLAIAGLTYLVPNVAVRFLGFSIGGLVTGYAYTAKGCLLLGRWKIIREVVV